MEVGASGWVCGAVCGADVPVDVDAADFPRRYYVHGPCCVMRCVYGFELRVLASTVEASTVSRLPVPVSDSVTRVKAHARSKRLQQMQLDSRLLTLCTMWTREALTHRDSASVANSEHNGAHCLVRGLIALYQVHQTVVIWISLKSGVLIPLLF